MKKKIIMVVTAVLLPAMSFAQVRVDASGNVGIGTSATTLSSQFAVGNSGESGVYAKITGDGDILKITGETSSSNTYSTFEDAIPAPPGYTVTYPKGIGLDVRLKNSLSYTSGFGVGVLSHVYDNVIPSTSSGSIGVLGSVLAGKSAGIYGTTNIGSLQSIDGLYAGYFQGNVKVTGYINGVTVSSSDARLKDNIQSLDADGDTDGGVLEKLQLLTPISYNYKGYEEAQAQRLAAVSDATATPSSADQVLEKTHFGFVAQELQEVYPDLVYEQDNGYLAVNYTELVPVLLQAIKELNEKVESLSGSGRVSRSPLLREGGVGGGSEDEATAIDNTLAASGVASMDQNAPNPFTEKTDIAIYLPESVQKATLYIYDLSGKQLEQHPIAGRGDTVMTIHADKMDAGMYVYSLIADKKVVTTKKMIVVK